MSDAFTTAECVAGLVALVILAGIAFELHRRERVARRRSRRVGPVSRWRLP